MSPRRVDRAGARARGGQVPVAAAERGPFTVEHLVAGGEGLARLTDGRVAFVPGALPGDRIEPLEIESRRGTLRVPRFRLIEPGAARVPPACAEASRCGGCDWMALAPDAQLREKARILGGLLERAGVRSPGDPPVAVQRVGPTLGYRGRLRLHVDADGVLGLHARGTHEVVPIRGCVVSDPVLSRGIAVLRAVGAEHLAELDAVELRVGGPGEPLLAVLSPRGPRGLSPMARRAFAAIAPKVRATEPADPDPPLHHLPLPGGTHLAVPPRVFAQVNWAVNLALVTRVVEGAIAASASRFCDAYAGAGNFTIPLVARGLRGVSLEVDRGAVEAARGALVAQGLPADGLRAVDAATGLAELAKQGEEFDLAVVDPPRAGAREALAPLLALAPRVIALGSCDPPTFARDLAVLVAGGYRLTSVEAFDMFPMTHHVEALAFLERGAARGAG